MAKLRLFFLIFLKLFNRPFAYFYIILKKSFNYNQNNVWRQKYTISKSASFVGEGITLEGRGQIIIGDFSHIARNSWLSAFEDTKIEIGKHVRIASNVIMITSNTKANQNFSKTMDRNYGDIFIGDFTWIGCNVYIKEGVRIGTNVVVGANSVVVRDIPDYSVYVGSKVIYKIIDV